MKLSIIERFERKYIPEPNSGCWLWIGAISSGYGHFNSGIKGQSVLAHRFAYELHKGPVPEGLELDHLCRTRSCCNPDHLEPVTRQKNVWRSPIWDGNKTHCPQGHEYSADNIYWAGPNKTKRQCKICHLALCAARYQRKKVERLNARS
jgi:hypothetical protein